MKDQSKKLQEIKGNSDAVFQEIFGLGAKNAWKKGKTGDLNQKGLVYEDDILAVLPDYRIHFKNTGSSINKPMPGYSDFERLDWGGNDLEWFRDAKFLAEAVQMDNGKVTRFIGGKWIDGYFKGRAFIKADFNGGFFNGEKFAGSRWNVHPYFFINGTTDEKNTILGLKNMSSLNQNKFKFNIIRVIPKSNITIQMQDGVTHEISVLKRLDSESSLFNFKIKNGVTGKVFSIPVKWQDLRGNSEAEFTNTTVFSNTNIPLLFTEKFGLEFKAPIVNVIVGESDSYEEEIIEPGIAGEKTEEELAVTQYSYDLNKAPFIGITKLIDDEDDIWVDGVKKKNTIGRVFLNLPTNEYFNNFENVVKNLDNKVLASDFTQLKSYLDNKVLTGAPKNYPWLVDLVGADKSGNKIQDENFIGSLNRIESFLKHFVGSIVKYAGQASRKKGLANVSNQKIRDQIKNNLKAYLGVESTEGPAASEVPVEKKVKKMKIPGAKNESVRSAVRNIISDNLKHF